MTDPTDPFNQRPTNPEWLAKCEALAKQAGKELDCLVMLVAVQPGGKIYAGIEGTDNLRGPEAADVKAMAEDPPKLIAWLAYMLKVQTVLAATQAKTASKQ